MVLQWCIAIVQRRMDYPSEHKHANKISIINRVPNAAKNASICCKSELIIYIKSYLHAKMKFFIAFTVCFNIYFPQMDKNLLL